MLTSAYSISGPNITTVLVSLLIPRRKMGDTGIIPQLIQPQQLIELPCIQANGTYDLVERNEEIRIVTWSYGKTLEVLTRRRANVT